MYDKIINGKLKNGIEYVISNNMCGNSLTIIIFFKVGSINELKHYNGMSHFIEHMFFKGSKKYPQSYQITNALYKYGAIINAFTDKDNTGFYVKINTKYLDKALEVLSDILYNSYFRDRDIKTEKNVVINEIERSKSDPNREIQLMISQLVYDGNKLAHIVSGNKKNIKQFTKEMIMAFLNKYYRNDNMLISIAGNIKKHNCIKILKKYFENNFFNYNSKTIYNNTLLSIPKYNNFIKNKIRRDLQQAYVSIAVPAFGINDNKSYIVDIIGTMLAGNMSSRLFIKMREKYGLIYSIKQSVDKYENTGALKLYFSTFNDIEKIKLCLKLIIEEFENMKKYLASQKELDDVRDYIIGNCQLDRENTKAIALFYGYNKLFMGKPYSYEYIYKKYKKINLNDIKNISNEIFQNQFYKIAIISKQKLI